MRTIVINSTNLVPDGENNKFVYKFPNSVLFKDDYVSLSSISIYYSWFNITSAFQNNIIQYVWDGVTFTITIPDGIYEVVALNALLQYTFIQNGHYLVDATGSNVYYAQLLVNPSRYAVQINTYLFPIALPGGWSNPAAIVFPAATFNPSLILPSNINEILGYVVNFTTNPNIGNAYTPPVGDQFESKLANGTLSYISTTAPNIQPNSSLLVALSNVDNAYAQPSSLIYTIVPSVGVGEIINERVPNFIWNKLIEGTYNELRLTILGTDLSPLKIRDPQITIVLVIRNKSESSF
tara:strand:+ start:932 stop:1813 length:882 start_codon:yes stop_codon:yes gene_type:complete